MTHDESDFDDDTRFGGGGDDKFGGTAFVGSPEKLSEAAVGRISL